MNFCEVDINDYNIRLFGIDYAGIVGIGLIDYNETPSKESLQDPDYWLTAATSPEKKYFVIRNTRGEYIGGEVDELEDLIGTRVVGAKHTAIIDSTGMVENWQYWNAVQSKLWKLCLVTSAGLLYYIDKPTSIYTKVNNQKSTKTQAYYQSEFKWYDMSNPVILNAPEGIFFGVEPILLGDGGFDYTLDFSFQ